MNQGFVGDEGGGIVQIVVLIVVKRGIHGGDGGVFENFVGDDGTLRHGFGVILGEEFVL